MEESRAELGVLLAGGEGSSQVSCRVISWQQIKTDAEAKYRGRIENLDGSRATELAAALEELERLSEQMDRPAVYAGLVHAASVLSPGNWARPRVKARSPNSGFFISAASVRKSSNSSRVSKPPGSRPAASLAQSAFFPIPEVPTRSSKGCDRWRSRCAENVLRLRRPRDRPPRPGFSAAYGRRAEHRAGGWLGRRRRRRESRSRLTCKAMRSPGCRRR